MTIPGALLPQYLAAPQAMDARVREELRIPSDRYYTVVTWPPSRLGMVVLDRHRVPPARKISKSNQGGHQ